MIKHEEPQVYALAAVGLAKGIYEVFVKPELTAERVAFIGGALIGGIATWEIISRQN